MSQNIGSKLQVWNGTAKRTSGGLVIADLIKNKRGKVVSKKQSENGKRAFLKNNLKPKTREELLNLKKQKVDN